MDDYVDDYECSEGHKFAGDDMLLEADGDSLLASCPVCRSEVIGTVEQAEENRRINAEEAEAESWKEEL